MGAKPRDQVSWSDLVQVHARRYPFWQIQDVYKLLYQAVCGPEHALVDRQAAWERLVAEWAALDSGPAEEALFEPLRPLEGLGRLNLRPYKAQGGKLESVWHAFCAASNRSWGTTAELEAAWEEIIAYAQVGGVAFAPADLRAFGLVQCERGFPPVHHSPVYREAYRPAYRLVLLSAWLVDGDG